MLLSHLLLWLLLSPLGENRVGHIAKTSNYNCLHFLLLSSSLKARSNVISYVTVNDSPDSDSSLSSPYSTDTLSALRGNSGSLLEGPGRSAADGTGTRTIIVPPLKTQLGDCTVATQTSGKRGLAVRVEFSLMFICLLFS